MTANAEILLLFCLAKLCRPRRRQIDGAIKHNDNSRDRERERLFDTRTMDGMAQRHHELGMRDEISIDKINWNLFPRKFNKMSFEFH